MPVRDDGTIDLTELARMSLEDMVNQIMDIQAAAADPAARVGHLDGTRCLPENRQCRLTA